MQTDNEPTMLRQISTMKEKAKYIDENLERFGAEAFLTLLEKEPSIALKTSDASEASLLHYLCVCVRNDDSTHPSESKLSPVLQKVWTAFPDAAINDPSILSTLIPPPQESEYLSGEWLDFVGSVGEHWSEAYEHLEWRIPPIECNWKRLAGSPKETTPFECYPHLMQRASSMLIDMSGINGTESGDEDRNMVNVAVPMMGIDRDGNLVQVWTTVSMPQQPVQSYDIPMEQVQHVLNHIVLHKGVERMCLRREGLLVEFRKEAAASESSECYIRIEGSNTGIDTSGLPCRTINCLYTCYDCFSFDADSFVRFIRLLAGHDVPKPVFEMANMPFRIGVLADGVVRVSANRSAIENLELNIINAIRVTGQVDPSGLSDLVNLKSLILCLGESCNDVGRPLVALLQRSSKLQHLDVRGCFVQSEEMLVEAVGRSKSLQVFCSSPDVGGLLRYLKTSNTTLVRAVHPDARNSRKARRSAVLNEVGYYCDLNRIGRGEIRAGKLSKAEFVLKMIGIFERKDDPMLEELDMAKRVGNDEDEEYSDDEDEEDAEEDEEDAEEDAGEIIVGSSGRFKLSDTGVTSLLYGLLREQPALWCSLT